ncbi:MAG: ORF6N domain-containing protein [Lachnospiraceae bacterium]|nr:ORF6N domain-containing protein [Ruminococcus sp.]MCM1273988.1 ORF6N domain-containing protein [Lachnospiraceae bacterium]
MTTVITINNKTLPIREYNRQRVVTFKDIDAVHGRPDGTAGRNFRDNRNRFIEGIDYFRRNSSEALNEFGIVAPNGLVLMTESGYLMLAKSFTDDLAWQVQRELVNCYFRAKDIIAEQADRLAEMKIRAAADRAAAMKMNAENRRLRLLLDHPNLKDLSPIAKETWALKSIEQTTGEKVGVLPECGELVQAGTLVEQWTKEFGVNVTANMLGRLANANNLKTEEYGIEAMDKSPYSAKEVTSFRYNPRGVAKLKVLAAAHYNVGVKQ